jgi:hypothetical protein
MSCQALREVDIPGCALVDDDLTSQGVVTVRFDSRRADLDFHKAVPGVVDQRVAVLVGGRKPCSSLAA